MNPSSPSCVVVRLQSTTTFTLSARERARDISQENRTFTKARPKETNKQTNRKRNKRRQVVCFTFPSRSTYSDVSTLPTLNPNSYRGSGTSSSMSLTPNFKYLRVQGKAYRNQSFMHMLGCTIPKQVLSQVMDLYVFSQIVRLLCLSCQVVSRTSESIIEVRAVIQDRTAAMVALSICVCDSPIGVRFCASQHEGLKPLCGIGASISDDM